VPSLRPVAINVHILPKPEVLGQTVALDGVMPRLHDLLLEVGARAAVTVKDVVTEQQLAVAVDLGRRKRETDNHCMCVLQCYTNLAKHSRQGCPL